jgi:hypothetical protein
MDLEDLDKSLARSCLRIFSFGSQPILALCGTVSQMNETTLKPVPNSSASVGCGFGGIPNAKADFSSIDFANNNSQSRTIKTSSECKIASIRVGVPE